MSNNSDTIGVMVIAPGSAQVGKSRSDLIVTCSKPGYATRTVKVKSGFVGTTFGNLLIGGAAGFLTDASTGANFVYPNEVLIYLPPLTPSPLPLASAS